MPMPPKDPSHTAGADHAPVLAAIDMGSNSFRLEIGRVLGGQYRRERYLKDTLRLGSGLDAQGNLSAAAMARGTACLRRFAGCLTHLPACQVRAVATQALREAGNRDAFLAQAQGALGHPIEVISGREEGRLIYVGVAQMQPSAHERLVVDIGGRSTEMILGRGGTPTQVASFAMGSGSLSLRYFGDGAYSAAAFRAAQVAAGAQLEEGLTTFTPARWREALGASGTAGAVAKVLRTCGVTDGRITPDALRWLMQRCLQAGHTDALNLPGLAADRKPILAGGLAILYTLVVHFGIDELLPTDGALRHGVIVDLHHRLCDASQDMRSAAVRALQRRFGVDAEQAQRVREVALALHAAVRPATDASTSTDDLRWAADLHEVGMAVSHHDHHRHSAYLLAHADAAGFSQNQLQRLATLVLGQRGGLRKMASALAERDVALRLLCLRLAVSMCHARSSVALDGVALQRRGRALRLTWPASWAASHPRTAHLLHEEAAAWAQSGVLTLRVG